MRFNEPAMRPPQEARSLLPQVTEGCSWNKCKFCNVSQGYRYKALKPEELEQQIAQVSKFYKPDTPIYLCGSNPFALPMRFLNGYIAVLRKYFPRFSRLSMQARIDDITHKTDEQLNELHDAGLTHLYIGTENGHEDVLRMMNKGHTASDTVRELLRLQAAGITYTNFYVLGLGGKGMGQASAKATAAMFNAVNPLRITTTGLTMLPNTEIASMAKRGEFQEASEREKIEELHTFLSELNSDSFYDGIHYLNPINYRFHNADAANKKAVLADIEEILANHTDEELEMMVNRKQMVSL